MTLEQNINNIKQRLGHAHVVMKDRTIGHNFKNIVQALLMFGEELLDLQKKYADLDSKYNQLKVESNMGNNIKEEVREEVMPIPRKRGRPKKTDKTNDKSLLANKLKGIKLKR